MTTFSDKFNKGISAPFQVLFVIYSDIVLLDLTGPLQVFAGAKQKPNGKLAYKTAITSLKGGLVPTDTVVSIDTEPMQAWIQRPIHTLVVVGGNGATVAMYDEQLIKMVSDLSRQSHRVCSVCSGALILAAAGLLNGRRATTHWEDCEFLEHHFPEVTVEIDPIYIKDDSIWTSAGITAGIDMALAIVSEDLGTEPALELAQSLLTYMIRPGGQSQFSSPLNRQRLDRSGKFDELHRWISDNLGKSMQIEDLAKQVNMSVRNFHRLYSSTMGITPAKSIEMFRIERAKELLETTGESIKVIASQCGFGEQERMRRAFIRIVRITPTDYRARFSKMGS